jgi:Tfp pilus assembly protein PilO
MSEHLYLLSLCLPLGTVLLVFGMRYVSAVQQARARLANDDAYRRIAETAAAAQSETAATLSAIQAALSEMKGRLAAVETILREVG